VTHSRTIVARKKKKRKRRVSAKVERDALGLVYEQSVFHDYRCNFKVKNPTEKDLGKEGSGKQCRSMK